MKNFECTLGGFNMPAPGFHGAGVVGGEQFERWRARVDGDDGTGSALFLGGRFFTAGNVANTRGVAKWNGSTFSALSTGITKNGIKATQNPDPTFMEVTRIASLNHSVYFAGNFDHAGSTQSNCIAEWGGCPPCPADFDGSGVVNVSDIFSFLRAWFAHSSSADIEQR